MATNIINGDIHYPSIIFRCAGGLFSADSRYVSAIIEQPEFQLLPNCPDYITGIFPYRGTSITMFDLRRALKMPAMEDEYNDFVKMLDARKQDHINWVDTLERCINDDVPFTLATDPHKCALGRWYDNFETDSQELKYHMSRLAEPHNKLHESAKQANVCRERHDGERDVCQKTLMRNLRTECVPKVLGVLEGAKEVFRTRVYHEMVLVLSGERDLGVVVDEVLAVDTSDEEDLGAANVWTESPYIDRVVKSELFPELILKLNVEAIFNAGDRNDFDN